MLSKFPFPFSFPRAPFLSFSEIFPLGFVTFFSLAFQSLDRDSLLPGVLIITSSVPSRGLLMESYALGFIQEFSACCSRDSRKVSHNWYWSKNHKRGFSWALGLAGRGCWLSICPPWGSVWCEFARHFDELRGEEVDLSSWGAGPFVQTTLIRFLV